LEKIRAGGKAQVVDCLLSKCEALSLNNNNKKGSKKIKLKGTKVYFGS
jgi:hypothetical protein